jgi:hypothetical protein
MSDYQHAGPDGGRAEVRCAFLSCVPDSTEVEADEASASAVAVTAPGAIPVHTADLAGSEAAIWRLL